MRQAVKENDRTGLVRLIQEKSTVKAGDAAFQTERAAIGSRENGKDDGTVYQDWGAEEILESMRYTATQEEPCRGCWVPALRWTGLRQASPGSTRSNLTVVPQKGT